MGLTFLKVYFSLKVAFRIYNVVKNKMDNKVSVVKVEK